MELNQPSSVEHRTQPHHLNKLATAVHNSTVLYNFLTLVQYCLHRSLTAISTTSSTRSEGTVAMPPSPTQLLCLCISWWTTCCEHCNDGCRKRCLLLFVRPTWKGLLDLPFSEHSTYTTVILEMFAPPALQNRHCSALPSLIDPTLRINTAATRGTESTFVLIRLWIQAWGWHFEQVQELSLNSIRLGALVQNSPQR